MNPDPELLVRHLHQRRETKPMAQPEPHLPGPISPLERETGVPITRVEVVTLQPGDLLVVYTPITLSAMVADKMLERLKTKVPAGVEVAIMSDELHLAAYRKLQP
jgi:hypothetical protein